MSVCHDLMDWHEILYIHDIRGPHDMSFTKQIYMQWKEKYTTTPNRSATTTPSSPGKSSEGEPVREHRTCSPVRTEPVRLFAEHATL